MIVVPLIYPFGLRIRRAVILSPAVFSTILIIGGVLLLIMTYFDIRKARVLAAQGGTITVDKGLSLIHILPDYSVEKLG